MARAAASKPLRIGIVHAHVLVVPGEETRRLDSLPIRRQKDVVLSQEYVARLEEGLKLYQNGKVDRLVVSATHSIVDPHVPKPNHPLYAMGEPNAMNRLAEKWLVERGVPSEHIIRIPGRLTVEETLNLRKVLKELRPSELHVVTSDWHLDRVVGITQAAFPDFKIIPHGADTRHLYPNGNPLAEGEPARTARDAENARRWREANAEAGRLPTPRRQRAGERDSARLEVPDGVTVLFDVGHVLVNADHRITHGLLEQAGVSPDKARTFFTGPYMDFEAGRIGEAEFYQQLLEKFGRTSRQLSMRRVVAAHDAHMYGVDQRVLDVMRQIPRDQLAIVTSTNPWQNRRERKLLDLRKYAHRIFRSNEMRRLKIDPETYRHIASELDTEPNRLVLVDDNPAVLAAARLAGVRAVRHVGDAGRLKSKLARLFAAMQRG